jgi:hypothetical protein
MAFTLLRFVEKQKRELQFAVFLEKVEKLGHPCHTLITIGVYFIGEIYHVDQEAPRHRCMHGHHRRFSRGILQSIPRPDGTDGNVCCSSN